LGRNVILDVVWSAYDFNRAAGVSSEARRSNFAEPPQLRTFAVAIREAVEGLPLQILTAEREILTRRESKRNIGNSLDSSAERSCIKNCWISLAVSLF